MFNSERKLKTPRGSAILHFRISMMSRENKEYLFFCAGVLFTYGLMIFAHLREYPLKHKSHSVLAYPNYQQISTYFFPIDLQYKEA